MIAVLMDLMGFVVVAIPLQICAVCKSLPVFK